MPETQDDFIFFEDPFEAAMAVHTLIMSVIYYTYVGVASEAAPRLSHLHALLDSSVLDKFPDGIVQVRISFSCNAAASEMAILQYSVGKHHGWSTAFRPSHAP